MITFECAWCEAELTIDSLDATSVECSDCSISIDFAPDEPTITSVAA
jgi:DNA-directed RNA polymerase subunit RPC12/RpoP